MHATIRRLIVLSLATLLLGLAVVAGLSQAAEAAPAAATVYVRTDGDDANCDGTTDAAYPGGGSDLPCAFATIGKGVQEVDFGGAVIIGPGTFAANVAIDKNLTLQGAGAGSTIIDGGGTTFVFSIGYPRSVEIASMTIRNGNSSGGGIVNSGSLLLSHTYVTSNTSSASGGGIYNNTGATVELIDTFVISNTASSYGGGIANYGPMTITNSSVSYNRSGSSAGGIVNWGGQLVIQDSRVSTNTAGFNAGGIFNYGGGSLEITGGELISNTAQTGGGGAIWSTYGPLTMTNTIVLSNTAGWKGGAITHEGVAALTGVTISGNTSSGGSGQGGGICIENGGRLTLVGSVVSGNAASSHGGGISVYTSNGGPRSATIINTIISDNTAVGAGGGIYNTYTTTLTASTVSGNQGNAGGGIRNHGTLTVTNSTISGNESPVQGGGLFQFAGVVDLTNVTVVSNTADSDGGGIYLWDTTHLVNTLVAGNTAVGSAPDCYGAFDSLGYNLIGDTDGCIMSGDLTGAISDTDALVGPLQDNGGRTPTHALLEGSPALNAGSDAYCLPTDQRGFSRLGTCDIGAYERNMPVFLPLVLKN